MQADARQSTANGTDRSWDAVWESAVSIIADKWIVEIKIPFSAIRFAKKDIQTWGLQLTRNIRKQLTQRDAIERQDCDVFTIGLDTYQDKQNGFIFQVSAAGVQADARQSTANGTDRSWDAVWESAVSIDRKSVV